MKLLLNYIGDEPTTYLDGYTPLKYIADNGDEFRIQPNPNGDGIEISVKGNISRDHLIVRPHFSNEIEVKIEK